MWALKSYNCERCGSDFISGRALKYHFQQKHLGKVHREECDQEVLREKLQGRSEGGSYVKGTDTQGCSEIDIVLLSEVFAGVKHFKKQLREGLETLRENLKRTAYGNRAKCRMEKAIAICDPCSGLTADLKLHLYGKLYLCKDSDEAQLCALALLPQQVDFVKASVVRVKELIRLMIHWFKTSFASPTEENKFRRLPSSYSVELLTIYVWERAEKPLSFSLVQGMRAVLKLLVQYADIDVVWHRHYHRKFPIFVKVNQKRTRPFILDPVNPTVNVCDTCNAWDEVAHVAKLSLRKPLFSGVRAEPPGFSQMPGKLEIGE